MIQNYLCRISWAQVMNKGHLALRTCVQASDCPHVSSFPTEVMKSLNMLPEALSQTGLFSEPPVPLPLPTAVPLKAKSKRKHFFGEHSPLPSGT